MAQKFIAALMSLVSAAPKPGALKTAVETVGFQHLDVATWHSSFIKALSQEVTVPRMEVFRDAILELFEQAGTMRSCISYYV